MEYSYVYVYAKYSLVEILIFGQSLIILVTMKVVIMDIMLIIITCTAIVRSFSIASNASVSTIAKAKQQIDF